ncbi:MAG: nuclear transport factor 2 family protein, partial [Gammaproteobacteria bacterium]|nr:nuclear transport factor 2 family protein [Gammaproteobacteria bacterium]
MDSYREIENLIYTYAELIDAGNLEGMSQLFSHAEFFGPDGKVAATGAEAFLALQRQAVKIYAGTGTPCTKHITTNVIIEMSESADAATARSYFTVFQSTEGLPLQPIIAGRYEDSFERVDGKWRFRQRQSIPEFYGDLSKHLLFDVSDRMR